MSLKTFIQKYRKQIDGYILSINPDMALTDRLRARMIFKDKVLCTWASALDVRLEF